MSNIIMTDTELRQHVLARCLVWGRSAECDLIIEVGSTNVERAERFIKDARDYMGRFDINHLPSEYGSKYEFLPVLAFEVLQHGCIRIPDARNCESLLKPFLDDMARWGWAEQVDTRGYRPTEYTKAYGEIAYVQMKKIHEELLKSIRNEVYLHCPPIKFNTETQGWAANAMKSTQQRVRP